jgi:hypothetical protein
LTSTGTPPLADLIQPAAVRYGRPCA